MILKCIPALKLRKSKKGASVTEFIESCPTKCGIVTRDTHMSGRHFGRYIPRWSGKTTPLLTTSGYISFSVVNICPEVVKNICFFLLLLLRMYLLPDMTTLVLLGFYYETLDSKNSVIAFRENSYWYIPHRRLVAPCPRRTARRWFARPDATRQNKQKSQQWELIIYTVMKSVLFCGCIWYNTLYL